MPSTLEEIAAESGIPKPIHAAVARLAIEAVHETPNTTSTDNKSTPKAPTVVSVSEIAKAISYTDYWLTARNVQLTSRREDLKSDTDSLRLPTKRPQSRIQRTRLTRPDKVAMIQFANAIKHDATKAFFENLTALSLPDRNPPLKKLDCVTISKLVELCIASYHRAEDNAGKTIFSYGPRRPTSEQVTDAYNSLAHFVSNDFELAPSGGLVFDSKPFNEAVTRQATDAFNRALADVWDVRGDSYISEQMVKLPTIYDPQLTQTLKPELEPEVAILDSGFAINIWTVDGNLTQAPSENSKNWEVARALSNPKCFEEYKEVFQYLMDISARPPDDAKAKKPVHWWGNRSAFFLIIEYKKEQNVSAVRQLAIQMTSVLHHNAIFGLHGEEFPIYGFAIEDSNVDMYQGWLVEIPDSSSPHSVFIEQVIVNDEPIHYKLINSIDVYHLYHNLDAIRTYGCGPFLEQLKKGVAQLYKDIAEQQWTRLKKGYDARSIMEQRKQKFLAKAAAKMREQGVTEAGTGVDGQEPGEMAPSKTKKAQSTSKMNRKAYDEADYPGGDVKPSPSDRTTRNRAQLPNLTPGSEDASDDWH